jgi:DNA-binding LacI/PurR family transcriptional regulator
VNQERLRGFHSGLKLHDIEPVSGLEISLATSEKENGCFDYGAELDKSPVTAHRRFSEIVERLMFSDKPPTAVFCFDYHTTLLLIQSLMRMGLTPGMQDQETRPKTNRMSQNLVRPDGQISEITESHPKMNRVPPGPLLP